MRFHRYRYRPRVWAAAALVAAASLITPSLTAQAGAADGQVVAAQVQAGGEDDGADCAVPNPGSPTSSSMLPDPFKRLNGTRISATSDWRCRRAEIRDLAQRSVYGQKPVRPASVTGTVSASSITVNVSDQGRSASFSASVSLPSGSGPFPAVVVLGGLGADTATIKASGVAVINYDPYSVGKEGTARNNKQGAFYSVYGSSSSTGLLMAWSWGVSRIIDVIEQSGGNILKASATGVTGCSRFGKGAIVAGAFDQRVALTMPIESGSGGVPILRGIPGENGAQPLSSAYSEQPWLGDAFSSYTGNPNSLPVDTHEILGMVAPRGLFVMENPYVDWLAARSGSVAALGAAEVYKALGAGSNISYWSDVQDGTHCAVRSEWKTPLQQNIQKFLLGTGSSSGVFRIAPGKSGNLSTWRDWQTPTLTDGGGGNGGDPGGGTGGDPGGDPGGGGTNGTCTAGYRNVNSWPGGFQGEVTIRNNGTSTLNGWTVGMSLASGQSISSLWDGVNTGTSGSVTVRNSSYNGTLAASGTATFGFTATGNSSPAPANITCKSP
ncbi:cellulose binding domain-containing protein [Streptomyces sp. NPDC056112]|uniref:glucuronyl esterase domain-containing protein n=1 Tax=unclassified Streptomyces TaxID=2593676 RepID=UPI00248063F4|nr:cellulose binding domain-containing protein [Streptomyces sp. HYC2]